jgi:hypothetical protein
MQAARPGPSRAAAALCALALSGCVVVPQTRHEYEPRCGVAVKRVVLEVAVLPGFHQCQGRGCAELLAAAGIVTAATAVVSGSVAVVGNVIYWAERKGQCPFPQGPAQDSGDSLSPPAERGS